MITKEEREDWRRMLSSRLPVRTTCGEMLRLLDALEEAEAEIKALGDGIRMEVVLRLQAEVALDLLAEELLTAHGCDCCPLQRTDFPLPVCDALAAGQVEPACTNAVVAWAKEEAQQKRGKG